MRYFAISLLGLWVACGPPSGPQPPVRERPRPRKIAKEDSTAYKVYQRLMTVIRAKKKSKQPVNLAVLLDKQVQKIPAGCKKAAAVVKRIETAENADRPFETRTPLPTVALLFLEPKDYNHCECTSSCADRRDELTQCSIAVVPEAGGRNYRLVVTSPKLEIHAHSKDLFVSWQERPIGQWLLTAKYEDFQEHCGAEPRPEKKNLTALFLGYSKGQFFEYLSMTTLAMIRTSTLTASTANKYEWVEHGPAHGSVLAVTEESYRRDVSTHPRTMATEIDVTCSRETTLFKLDLKKREIVKYAKAQNKRLLSLPVFERFKSQEMSGNTAEKCGDFE